MIEEFLKELNIENQDGEDNIVVELEGSDDYSRFYTKLEHSELVDLDEEASAMDHDNSVMVYVGDDFVAKLYGNLERDIYRLVIEKEENDA